ncbi:7642_t:CDS:2, partial [Racocetra persica]
IIVDSDDSLDSNLDINDVSQEAFSLNNNLVPSIEVGKTFTKKSLGIIIRADIVCHHAGIAKKTSTGLRTTKSIVIGCSFKIVVHWINNEYHVRSANLEHNHPMDTAVTLFDPGHHKLSYNKKDQVNILFNSGIPVPTIIRMLSEQYGRYIHNKDIYNSLNFHSRDRIKGLSQISELLTYLHNNSEYKITYLVNDNKLHCLFFATQSAFTIFKCYPEIVLIDTTYKTIISECHFYLLVGDLAVLSAIRTELPHVKHQLCTWHIEQNIVKNLTSKLSNKFLAFSKDFKLVITETKSISHMWVYCYTNKNVNYGIRTTQHSEASNAHLKHQLGHIQYHLRGSTHQQCPELLKNISMVISDFVYSLLLAQYNSATLYSVEEQVIGLFKVFNENRDHIVYHTEIELIISATDTNNVIQSEEPYDINNNKNSSTTVLSSSNYDACEIQISKQSTFKSTANLIKEIKAIANRDGHIEINNCLSLFIEKLNNQYPLQQADIGDSTNIKTKGRPSNTKRKKT